MKNAAQPAWPRKLMADGCDYYVGTCRGSRQQWMMGHKILASDHRVGATVAMQASDLAFYTRENRTREPAAPRGPGTGFFGIVADANVKSTAAVRTALLSSISKVCAVHKCHARRGTWPASSSIDLEGEGRGHHGHAEGCLSGWAPSPPYCHRCASAVLPNAATTKPVVCFACGLFPFRVCDARPPSPHPTRTHARRGHLSPTPPLHPSPQTSEGEIWWATIGFARYEAFCVVTLLAAAILGAGEAHPQQSGDGNATKSGWLIMRNATLATWSSLWRLNYGGELHARHAGQLPLLHGHWRSPAFPTEEGLAAA